MMTRMSGRLVVALGVVLGICATSFANPVPFDDFTAPAATVQRVVGASGGGNPSALLTNTQAGVASSLRFGDVRTITAQRMGGFGTFDADVNTTLPNQYAFANGADTGSIFTINYNFAAQGFSLDFSANDLLTLVGIDLDAGDAEFTVTTTDGTNSFTTAVQTVQAGDPIQDLDFNITGGLVNASAITGLTIRIDTVNPGLSGTDGRVADILIDDGVRITGDPTPEPASMALFGLVGLGGMLAARRKMRKNRA
jgi:hypothetical protein